MGMNKKTYAKLYESTKHDVVSKHSGKIASFKSALNPIASSNSGGDRYASRANVYNTALGGILSNRYADGSYAGDASGSSFGKFSWDKYDKRYGGQTAAQRASSYHGQNYSPNANTVIPPDEYEFAVATGLMSRGDSDKAVASALRAIISVESLIGIAGLPYIPDNVVDPPIVASEAELSGSFDSWSTGLVGSDYAQRVVERGQFLVLSPIELRPNLTDTVALAIQGASGGLVSGMWNSLVSKLDRFEARLNVMSYGFTARHAAKRYWRSVRAHAKAVFYSLGIDPLDSSKPYKLYDGNAAAYLPRYIYENVYASTDMDIIINTLNAGEKKTDEIKEYEKQVSSSSKGGSKGVVGKLLGGDTGGAIASAAESVVSSAGGFFGKIGGLLGGGLGGSAGTAASTEVETETNIQDPTRAPWNAGMSHLIKFVMNADTADSIIGTLPFSIFYCNGPIERNYTFNIETGTSKLGENAILASKQATKSFAMGFIGKAAASAMNAASANSVEGGAATAVQEAPSNFEAISDSMSEWAYHNSGVAGGGFLLNNLYIPKVQTGGSSAFGWTVNIRDMALSSDRYSLARMMFTLCLLLPYVYQTSMPRQALILPTSALYCAAFSKGVINAPRAVITNLSVKTENAFQTSFGVPTELDITLTIEPLFTISTMPDFNKYWGMKSSGSEFFVSALWNPMSSMNFLATLCGQNTVFTKYPQGLVDYFLGTVKNHIKDTLRGTVAAMQASYRDWTSSAKANSRHYMLS